MKHPDFRVGGKIFATLGYPSAAWAMVALTPVQQQLYTVAHPKAFIPVKGAWGARGATNVRLRDARKRITRHALTDAWRNRAPEHLVEERPMIVTRRVHPVPG